MIKIESIDAVLPNKFKKRDFYENLKFISKKENKIIKDLFIFICSDEYLLQINRKHLNHDYYTDIITFDYSYENIISCELYISVDRIVDNAKKYNIPFLSEFFRITIHGLLHCIGFNDKTKTDKIIMTEKENIYLQLFSY